MWWSGCRSCRPIACTALIDECAARGVGDLLDCRPCDAPAAARRTDPGLRPDRAGADRTRDRDCDRWSVSEVDGYGRRGRGGQPAPGDAEDPRLVFLALHERDQTKVDRVSIRLPTAAPRSVSAAVFDASIFLVTSVRTTPAWRNVRLAFSPRLTSTTRLSSAMAHTSSASSAIPAASPGRRRHQQARCRSAWLRSSAATSARAPPLRARVAVGRIAADHLRGAVNHELRREDALEIEVGAVGGSDGSVNARDPNGSRHPW